MDYKRFIVEQWNILHSIINNHSFTHIERSHGFLTSILAMSGEYISHEDNYWETSGWVHQQPDSSMELRNGDLCVCQHHIYIKYVHQFNIQSQISQQSKLLHVQDTQEGHFLRSVLATKLTLRKIDIWMSKNCQKLDIFFQKNWQKL